ncbi:hypothetical protein [Christiangramia forsetii]|uniref:Uncharacterized protein n=1 Tax=Christiangramia forsetii (strain DSM 17595 / CGMCC 1.15422 / KT0803) TaxID=411154 RepID=A0M6A1_CHRFK|nr:hypothetical protein [Christiangramia forsetii]CAL68146.1 hypothetical protein GFO_3203 [Christiangramia forsetii KT0803]
MKIPIFFLVLIHLVFLAGEEQESTKYNTYNAQLCIGDRMNFGKKSIKFKGVISDSRCPKGVTCIWAGEVKVLVEFYEDGEFKGEKIIVGSNILVDEMYVEGEVRKNKISTGSKIPVADFFSVKDLFIDNVIVLPYPNISEKISPEQYRLNLKVSEEIEED